MTPTSTGSNAGSNNLIEGGANVSATVNGIEVSATATTDKKHTEELVFDMDSGEMVTREEF